MCKPSLPVACESIGWFPVLPPPHPHLTLLQMNMDASELPWQPEPRWRGVWTQGRVPALGIVLPSSHLPWHQQTQVDLDRGIPLKVTVGKILLILGVTEL